MLTLRITGALLALAALAGCSSPPDTAEATGSGDRTAKLHDAAECLRQHGVQNFHDPVLGADGQVFTDTRALEEKEPQTTVSTALTACRDKINAANWHPAQVPPAPASLVAAGRTACPTSRTRPPARRTHRGTASGCGPRSCLPAWTRAAGSCSRHSGPAGRSWTPRSRRPAWISWRASEAAGVPLVGGGGDG